jgi:hypothetical protein
MNRYRFEWDEQNLGHIAQHLVEQDEAEAVVSSQPGI